MNFKRGAKDLYKNDEKLELAKTVEKYKRQFDEEVEDNRWKIKYDYKSKNKRSWINKNNKNQKDKTTN